MVSWRELYPFQSRFWDRQGLKLHYIDEGRGEPVVMVHGNPTWSFYYRDLAKALRETHRVIAPDHIGMGLSDKPGEARYRYTFQSRVDDLEGLLEHLGVNGDVTVVAHDWGGAIALAWACRHPERVKRIVLFNTAAFLPPPEKPLPWSLSLARSPLGPLLVQGFNAFCLGAAWLCGARRPLPAAVREGFLAPYDSWANRLAVLRFVQDIPILPAAESHVPVRELGEKLQSLASVPALICWGGRDFVFDMDFLEQWRRRWPQARVRLFEDAGHYVLEDAAEEIIPLVVDFLRPVSSLR